MIVCEISLNITFAVRFGGWVVAYFFLTSLLSVVILAQINFEVEKKELLIPWFLVLTFFPLVGAILLMTFKQKHHAAKKLEKAFAQNCDLPQHEYAAQAKYYAWGKDFFEDVKKQVKNAKKYVFFEFYIVEYGKLFDELLEIIKQKIQQGVKIYMLVDGIGSIARVPKSFCRDMKKLGIACAKYNSFSSTLLHNNRDHRKIVVVDGKTLFLGGVNLADEYVGEKQKYGIWKDCGLKVEGDGVRDYVKTFCVLFGVASNKKLDAKEFVVDVKKQCLGRAKNIFMQPSCVGKNLVLQKYLVDLFESAQNEIKISTPYFIPNSILQTAICRAAQRGVKIKIFVPGIADKKYVNIVTKSFYEKQIGCGVEIYEFKDGFVHSKNLLIDNKTMLVGTINFDGRSLFRNFECAVQVRDCDAVKKLSEDFLQLEKQSKIITHRDLIKPTFFVKLLRLFAPML